MGSALPYDDRHDNETRIVACDKCGMEFERYPDAVNTCTNCLLDPFQKKNRKRQEIPIAHLFDT